MSTRILSDVDVRALLPMEECIDLMEETLRAASHGEFMVPLRQGLPFPKGGGLLGLMPALSTEPRASGVKVVNVMPGNHGTGYDSHLGVVLYFDGEYGRLRGIIDATSVTAIRTAAASGAATRALARKEASVLGLFGSGVQARTHLEAMLAVRPIRRILVYTLNAENGERFKQAMESRFGVEIELCSRPEEVCVAADILCTTTSSKTPVFQGEWLKSGTHINAVGACLRPDRELDTKTVIRSRLYTDRRESLWAESGDVLIPLEERAIDESHLVGEIGEVFAGDITGRGSEEEVTLFKSLGFAAEDLAAARYLVEAADGENRGLSLDLGGRVET